MILTEPEAKERWCPFGAGVPTMVSVANDGTAEVMPVPKEQARCIASQCMAWRWAPYPEWVLDSAGAGGGGGEEDGRRTFTTTKTERRNTEPRRGFCGLAGKAG